MTTFLKWSTKFAIWALILTAIVKASVLVAKEQGKLKVAVASNFYLSLQLLLETDSGLSQTVSLISGSTGLLYAQVIKGAPFDVFLSADEERPTLLEQRGLVYLKRSYTEGKLVLWPVKDKTLSLKETLSLYSGKLAIANPKLAPYGAAANEVLINLGQRKSFQQRLVLGNNINQVFQFVDSSNLGLAFIAESQLRQAQKSLSGAKNKYKQFIVVPHELHQKIDQYLVVLKQTKKLDSALDFVTWLTSKRVQSKLTDLGYSELDD